MPNILVLGGTTEASRLTQALADRRLPATLSYAGRVNAPRAQPVPVRIGGFGGVEGLARYLREAGVTHLVDATHPFAATMSANAIAAAQAAAVPYIALGRPPWMAGLGDRWRAVPTIGDAVAALDGPARRIMLALGRMHVDAFAARPQHHYLLRFVDRPAVLPALPDHRLIVDRGPFDADSDATLMRDHGIDLLLCKNAGGEGARAKLIAARALGLPVIMIDRPFLPARPEVYDVADVLAWIDHSADLGV